MAHTIPRNDHFGTTKTVIDTIIEFGADLGPNMPLSRITIIKTRQKPGRQ